MENTENKRPVIGGPYSVTYLSYTTFRLVKSEENGNFSGTRT